MTNKSESHWKPSNWKRDVQLLTSLLRLRVQPPVSYAEITALLLDRYPREVFRLCKKHGSKAIKALDVIDSTPSAEYLDQTSILSIRALSAISKWVEEYLENFCIRAERQRSESWVEGLSWQDSAVSALLQMTGLWDRGYEAMTDTEVGLQIKWRRERSWRAGSVPLRGSMRLTQMEILDGACAIGPTQTGVATIVTSIEQESERVEILNTPDVLITEKHDVPEPPVQKLKVIKVKLKKQPIVLQLTTCETSNTPPQDPIDYRESQEQQNGGNIRVESTLVDPITGQKIRFYISQVFSQSCGLGLEPKADARLRSCGVWNSFADQLEDIKAMERAMRTEIIRPE